MVQAQLRARGIKDEGVLEAMRQVPRHEFVEPAFRPKAYEDHPVPIKEGQTISQPYIVAITLEALSLKETDIVLEIGTGSGYQTALLATLAWRVYSLERHERLSAQAQQTLTRLGYANVKLVVADGSEGLPEFAPYDAIAVSAAAPLIPEPLLAQLRENGRMVIPVGPGESQTLQLVQKRQGMPVTIPLESCRFVPLIGAKGYGN